MWKRHRARIFLLSMNCLIAVTTTKWEAQRRYLQGGYHGGDHDHGNARVDHHKRSLTTACARAIFTACTSSSHESNLFWRGRPGRDSKSRRRYESSTSKYQKVHSPDWITRTHIEISLENRRIQSCQLAETSRVVGGLDRHQRERKSCTTLPLLLPRLCNSSRGM
jgi:hypothetical protein